MHIGNCLQHKTDKSGSCPATYSLKNELHDKVPRISILVTEVKAVVTEVKFLLKNVPSLNIDQETVLIPIL